MLLRSEKYMTEPSQWLYIYLKYGRQVQTSCLVKPKARLGGKLPCLLSLLPPHLPHLEHLPLSSSLPGLNKGASFKSHPGSSQELGDQHVRALHRNTFFNASARDWGICDTLSRVGIPGSHSPFLSGRGCGHSISVVLAAE